MDSQLPQQVAWNTTESGLIGASPAFKKSVLAIQRIAAFDATTLVQGETGTGKDLAARAIHYLSARQNCPFVPVNCGAIPAELIESELFGHAKGAFTDAKAANPGLVTIANGGTLFLDEIECLSPKGQVVLLRFLQDHTFRPVGGKPQSADLRVIAATNCDLMQMVQAGEFRLDLYYRLALLTLVMPPLRERPGDPELLAHHFLAMGCKRYRISVKAFHPCTLEWFGQHLWPGNVRELENLIYRELLISEGDEICLSREPSSGDGAHDRRRNPDRRRMAWLGMPYKRAKALAVFEFDRIYLSGLLTQVGGNVAAAARFAGKERRTFDRLLQKNGIDKNRFRN